MTLGPIKRPVRVSQNVLCFASSNTPFTLYDCWTTVCRSVHTMQLLHRELDKLSHVVFTLCDGLSNSFSWLNSRLIIQLCCELSINLKLCPSIRTACYGEQHAVRGRIEETRAFTINLILTWTSKLITIAANRTDACTRTQPVHGSSQRTEKWHFVPGASPQNDFSAFARRPRFL